MISEKLKILRGVVVIVLIFAFVFLPLGNLFESYLEHLPLPKSVKEITRKVSQTRTASAATDGPNNPGTDASVLTTCSDNMTWSGYGTPGGSNLNDSTFITTDSTKWDATDTTDGLQMTNFGFALTNVASIDGITVEILAWTSAGGGTYGDAVLLTAATRRGDDKADASALPTSDPGSTYKSFGGAADDWYPAGSWTEAEIEASGFGVEFCFTSTAADSVGNVDHVRITVYYTQSSPVDLSWDTGTADFEIWAGATSTTDADLSWNSGTKICEVALNDDINSLVTCGAINKGQRYRIQVVLANVGGVAASMAGGDFVDQVNVQTFWAGSSASLTDCGFNDTDTDDTSASCSVAYNNTNDVRITQTGTEVLIAATTGTEGFMYRITTDSDVSLSDSSSYWNASIDTITEDSSRITIGLLRIPGNFIRGWIRIRGLVKFR